MTFELKGWGFVCRQVIRGLVSEVYATNNKEARDLKSTFCTHRFTKSEKVWRNYSNCGGICNYYKSSQPTKAALSTLHEVHWKLWEQKVESCMGLHFSASTVCFLSFITKRRNYLGVFKVTVRNRVIWWGAAVSARVIVDCKWAGGCCIGLSRNNDAEMMSESPLTLTWLHRSKFIAKEC